jgi:hypothetical protein
MRVAFIVIAGLVLVGAGTGTTGAQTISSEVPAGERAVLMQLFAATGGEHWKARDGWGTSTPVCDWTGVSCDFVDGNAERPFVASVRLAQNDLEGTLPATLADLAHLQSLELRGNRLTGPIPEPLLVRWDAHELDLSVEGNGFSNLVVRATIMQQAGGVLCAENEDVHYRIDLDALTHRAVFQSVRCHAGSRRTYCLRKEGTPASLERLARGLTAVGFAKLKPSYHYAHGGVTHGATVTTTAVWGDGTRRSLETYDRQGPRAAWLSQQLFLGLVTETSWEKESRTPACDFK